MELVPSKLALFVNLVLSLAKVVEFSLEQLEQFPLVLVEETLVWLELVAEFCLVHLQEGVLLAWPESEALVFRIQS